MGEGSMSRELVGVWIVGFWPGSIRQNYLLLSMGIVAAALEREVDVYMLLYLVFVHILLPALNES
jgi:hypothetical protein